MPTPASFWDKAAAKYAASPIKNQENYDKTLARVRDHLKRADKALELGCGTGTTALLLADAAAHITATDISAEMIKIAKGKAADQGITNVEFKVAPADSMDAGAPYDAILAFNLLHLVDDLEGTLSNIADGLAPGGLFISKTPCLSGPMALIFWPLIKLLQLFGKAPYVRFLSAETLEDLIQSAGLELVEAMHFPKAKMSRFVVARRR